MTDSTIATAPTPEFLARANKVLSQWREGTFSFVEAIDQFNTMKYEALQDAHPADEALIERLTGILRMGRGHYDHAIRHFRTARDIHEQLGDTERLLMCDNNIGEVYRLKGELERAHSILQMTYEAATKHGFLTIQAYCKSNDGRTLVGMKLYTEALVTLKEAAAFANNPAIRANIVGLISLIHSDLANAYLGLGEHALAFDAAQLALTLGEESKEVRRQAQANRALGCVVTVYTADDTTSADIYFERSIAQCRDTRLDMDLALTLATHGESLAARGKYSEARTQFQEALWICERLDVKTETEKIKNSLAELANK